MAGWGTRVATGLLAAFTSMTVLAQPPAGAGTGPLASAGPADLAEGRRAYAAQCAVCHGIDGSGGYGPSLLRPTFVRAADDQGLISILDAGIPGLMPGYGSANGALRTWQLAAFVRSLTRASAEPVGGNASNGLAIYQKRGCAGCHVVDGVGRAIGPDLSDIGVRRGAAYLKEAVVAPAARVPEGHVVVSVRPKGGTPVRGVRVSEDAFWVHVRDTSGRLHAFRVSDLDDLTREAGASLMPAYDLPASDLDDLVAYLASLRGQR